MLVNTPALEYLVEESQGENIFLFPITRKARTLEKEPKVKEVKARKLLPSTIKWEVILREPALCIRKRGKWWGVDEDGVIFSVDKPAKYPILLRDGDIEEGKVYPDLRIAVLIYRELRKEIPSLEIRSIETKEKAVIFRLGEGIRVIFAQEDVYSQIQRLRKILKKRKPSSYIDLRFGEYVIVR